MYWFRYFKSCVTLLVIIWLFRSICPLNCFYFGIGKSHEENFLNGNLICSYSPNLIFDNQKLQDFVYSTYEMSINSFIENFFIWFGTTPTMKCSCWLQKANIRHWEGLETDRTMPFWQLGQYYHHFSTIKGRCIKEGISQPNALYNKIYFGLEDKYSEPLITWVIFIRWSSTTLANYSWQTIALQ